MSAIATRFSHATTKFQVTAAACAVAAAATLTPAIAAQADIATPAPLAPVTQVLDNIAQDSWFQNQLWWIGAANPNPPDQFFVVQFQPLSFIPGVLRPVYKTLTAKLNFQVCFAGASAKIGPYGTFTVSFGRGC